MIKFCCKNCGENFSVPEIHAGKKGKCPKCKNIILVPQIQDTIPLATADQEVAQKDSRPALTFLDIPKKDKPKDQLAIQEYKEKLEKELKIVQSEPAPKRKLPWVIDIFLYPASVPGLINLAIFIGVPLLIGIVGRIIPIQLSILFFLVSLAVNILVFFYIYWYFAECVRDSADGEVRAPEGLGASAGLGGMFSQTVNIIGCLPVFFGPFVFYILFARRVDIIFWLLLLYAVSFFPMGLLAVVMFDSPCGLNPRLLIRSISRTFFPYCGLVLLFVAPAVLIGMILPDLQKSPFGEFVLRCVIIYMALVGAHLLGRFYWRYQEKLRWDV